MIRCAPSMSAGTVNLLRFTDLAEAWAFVRTNPGYGYPVPQRPNNPEYWLVPRTVGVIDERRAAEARRVFGRWEQWRRR